MTLTRLFRAILSRLGIWWEKYYIMQTDIDINIIDQQFSKLSDKIEHKIVKLTYEDFLRGEKSFCTDKKMNKYKEWFNDPNREAYGIIIDNDLAYSSWICYDKIELTKKTVIQKYENNALLQDAYCHTKYRGLGLHSYVNLYRLKKINSKNYKYAIVIVRTKNVPALKTQTKSTLKIKEELTLYSLFGKEILRYK